ncbi:hypothetical protein ACJX0J_032171 [Zea mays]
MEKVGRIYLKELEEAGHKVEGDGDGEVEVEEDENTEIYNNAIITKLASHFGLDMLKYALPELTDLEFVKKIEQVDEYLYGRITQVPKKQTLFFLLVHPYHINIEGAVQ